METVYVTVSANVSATFKVTVPEHWSPEETEERLTELGIRVSVDTDETTVPGDVKVEALSLDGVDLTYRDIWS